jgi:multiple antibiotic resistance protein
MKFFFLFAPFFALTMFLSLTKEYTEHQRRRLSVRVSIAVVIICLFLFFFGNIIFKVFGITLDAFRVGAGALLFFSAVRLVKTGQKIVPPDPDEDVAVVPIAIPVVVGPATIGSLLVLGGAIPNVEQRMLGCIALVIAVACLGLILLLGSAIERAIGKRGINILSKITGLILAALAAQMILTGIRNFFFQ